MNAEHSTPPTPATPTSAALVTIAAFGGDSRGSPLERSLREQTFPGWILPPQASSAPGETIASAINRQVLAATTPYVMLASTQATLHPTLLEKCLWFLWTHPRYAFINAHEHRTNPDGSTSLSTRAFFDADCVIKSHELGLHAMARRDALLELSPLDESLDGAASVWDFWLRAAERDRWGSTIAEVLIHRPWGQEHGDASQATILQHTPLARAKYPRSVAGRTPVIEPRWPKPFDPVRTDLPASWTIGKPRSSQRYAPSASTRAPRLLLLAPWLRMGGADKFNLDLCRLLKNRGWELTIACTAPSKDEWADLFEETTRDIFRPHLFLHWADYPPLLRSLIHTRQPDVVLTSNSELAYHLVPYFRALHPEPLYVDYVHMEEQEWKSGGHARHSVGMHDQLDLSLVTSDHLKTWMTDRGAIPSRIAVCPIGVDHRLWKQDPSVRDRVRRELGIGPDEHVILHAGRICPQKQPPVLARTLELLHQRGTQFIALIAGDGEDRPWLQRHLAAHGLTDRVRMLGDVPSDRVRDLMLASDLFFLPSRWEGVALVLYEAMAAGTVFVGADVGGQREVATPETSVLLPTSPLDPMSEADSYAQAIARLFNDPPARRAMAGAARSRIEEHYTYDALLDRFLASIESARRFQESAPRQRLSPSLAHELAVRAIEMIRLEWHEGHLWKERDHWKQAATGATVVEAGDQNSPRARVGAIRRVMRALRNRGS